MDEDCRYPYEFNNSAPFLRKDIGKLQPNDLTNLFPEAGRKIMIGCAPCQPFSTYNQKNEDPNWRLLNAFGELIESVRPDVVSMENVPRLVRFKEGKIFRKFVSTLKGAKYDVAWGILYGPDYGLAQTRSRLVLLASRLGRISLPPPTHAGNHPTVREAIGDLSPLTDGEIDMIDPLHRASRLSSTNKARIAASLPGGTWRDWGAHLVAPCHKVETGKGYSSVYGRMNWSAPAPTITTQFYGFGNGRFGHPEQHRALSLREGALLQGFPREYAFSRPGDPIHFKKIGRLIGNAVPVHLARAIARAVRHHLETAA